MATTKPVPARHKKEWLKDQIVAAMEHFEDSVASVYGVTDPEFKIETEIGEWRFNWFRNRNLRFQVMGNPIWYCEVIFTGPSFMTKENESGEWLGGIHEYAVSLFLEYKPGQSTDLFEDMTDEISENRKGLLLYLRELGIEQVDYPDPTDSDPDRMSHGFVCISIRQTGDEEMYRDQRSIVNFDKSQPGKSDKGHLLTFRCQVMDVA